MRQTKGAIGNLLNRYKAVLKKCNLLNTFGSLAVASMLVMGGAGVAQADPQIFKDNETITGTFENLTNEEKNYAPVVILEGVKGVTIESGTTFTGNTNSAATFGGAIKALGQFFIQDNVKFSSNIAGSTAFGGGALYIRLGDQDSEHIADPINIGAVEFSNNKAESTAANGGLGGAIALEYGNVKITGATFDGNEANHGGAIANWYDASSHTINSEEYHSSLTSENTIYNQNTASQNGGAILFIDTKATFTSTNDTYTGNMAAYGGAIYNTGTTKIYGGKLTENSAANGGAIYNNQGTVEVSNGTVFDKNTAKAQNYGGGAIYSSGGKVKIGDNVTFSNNYLNQPTIDNTNGELRSAGGAIAAWGSTELNVGDNVTFENNGYNSNGEVAWASGGAIYLDTNLNAPAKMTIGNNAIFRGNVAGSLGGAIYAGDAQANIESATFESNKAGSWGGAIFVYEQGTTECDAEVNIKNSKFINNSAGNYGGALAVYYDADANISDSSFTNNEVTNDKGFGGGIYNIGSLTLNGNNTLSGNTVAGNANDIYNAKDTSGTGTITVASGTTTVGALVNNGTIKVGGEGSAATLSINDSWTAGNDSTMNVGNLGTLAVSSDIILADGATPSSYAAEVAAGGTYRVDGLEGTLNSEDVSALQNLLKAGSDGLLDLGDAEITIPEEQMAHGHYVYADTGSLANIVNNQSLGLTADVDSSDTLVKGGFANVHLTDAETKLVASTLILAGTEDGTKLVYHGANDPNAEGAQLGDLRIGKENDTSAGNVTLGLADKNNKGTLGNVTFTGYEGKEVILNAVGACSAEFTAGEFIIGTASDTKVVVDGATLNTTGFNMDENYGPLDTASVNNGTFAATDGSMDITNVELSNGGKLTASIANAEEFSADKGNIDISGTLHGQGTVDAENKLTLSNEGGLTTIETDLLTLRGNEISFNGVLDSTDGEINIDAGTLATTGPVTVKDDTITAKSWILNDSLTANSSSVLQAEQFGDDAEGASTLNKTVSLNDSSLLVHGDLSDSALNAAKDAITDAGNTGSSYYAGKTMKLGNDGNLHLNAAEADRTNAIVFGDGSLLIVDSNVFSAEGAEAVFTSTNDVTAVVDAGSTLYAVNAQSGDTFTVFGDKISGAEGSKPQWTVDNILADTPMLEGSYNEDGDVTFTVADPMEQFPGLSEDLAPAITTLYANKLNNVNASEMGVRFLSRATNDAYLGRTDRRAAASTIESAARIAFAGAVPQMTKMASDAATNAVVNRLGFANPENGAKAMNVDGKLVDDKALGLALWIAPLWSNQTGFGMEAGNLDYGYNANLGGISLGADYTWANNIRAGLMFNIGGGYAESAGGDLSETTNSMTFWGVGAYGGWEYNNFAVMADVSYTSTWNSVDQDVDHRMGMGDLEADIQASAISAGLRFEYKLETQYLDLIPHVGARYMSINTWDYDVETNGGTVLEGDGFQQNIWTFPVGITFSKELEMNNDWHFKPSVDFTVIPAAGDIKAKEDVRFTGLPNSTEIETQMMDYFTWQGGVGLEFGNDNMSVGVNYTLQAGQNSTGHGVFGMFRYEF